MKNDYVVIFRHIASYVIASGDLPDLHEDRLPTKKEALLAARKFQIERGADPNFILDLTNVPDEELSEFLR